MEEITTVTLEDNITYVVVDKIETNDNKYVYLTNINDEKDFCIRKIIIENDKEMLVGLNDKNEFDLALLYFTKKHNE